MIRKTALALLASLVAALSGIADETPKRPNFIFFITDDQFKDMMNWLPQGEGQNLTPHTDKLATEGTVVNYMYATSPVCTPSRFACLTGKFPSRSTSTRFTGKMKANDGQAVVEWNTFITEQDENTLPKILQRNGYTTGITGKNHVIEAEGIKLAEWDSDPTDPKVKAQLLRNAKVLEEACHAAGFDYAKNMYDNNPSHNGVKALLAHNMDWVTQGAVNFLELHHEDPFFLYVATTTPHGPVDDARSWQADPHITPEGLLEEIPTVQPARDTLPKRLKEAGIKGWQKENLLWMDDGVGAIMTKLEEVGQLDNTIFVYFNDHGQKSKGTVYDGGVHSEAFFWRKGGFPEGDTTNAMLSNVDFAPTILDYAGIEFDPEIFDGVSFKPVLEGDKEYSRTSAYYELGYVRGIRKGDFKYIALRYPESVQNMSLEERQKRLDRFNASQIRRGKEVYTEDPMAPFSHIQLIPGGGDAEHPAMSQYPAFYDADQLYNIARDPREQVNLASNPEYAEKLKEMKAALTAKLETLPGTFGELKPE